MTELLLLITSDHRARKTAVTNPRVIMRTRVTATHPTQELTNYDTIYQHLSITYEEDDYSPIINDKVGEDKLVRVEQEGRYTKRKNGNPEVDEVRGPER